MRECATGRIRQRHCRLNQNSNEGGGRKHEGNSLCLMEYIEFSSVPFWNLNEIIVHTHRFNVFLTTYSKESAQSWD